VERPVICASVKIHYTCVVSPKKLEEFLAVGEATHGSRIGGQGTRDSSDLSVTLSRELSRFLKK
jgi:hypothetical protein